MKFPRFPELLRQFLAETLGTFLLVVIGNGSVAHIKLGGAPMGSFLNIALGYGFGLMIGILVSGGVSGGHLNPAVTLTMAVFKRCRWIQVPVYLAAQHLGAFLASAVLYGIYYDGIKVLKASYVPNAAGIFASYPGSLYELTVPTLVFDQLFGTCLLLIVIFAVTDEHNMSVPKGLIPFMIGMGLTAIHLSFGLNSGCAINPARDFVP